MKKSMIIVMLALLVLAACETRVIMPSPGEQPNALTVNGVSEFQVAPDLAKVRFGIETQSPTAQDAQNRNRQTSLAVHDALIKAGVRESDLETADYRVERIQEWDPTGQKMVDKGYRATNTFVLSVHDLPRVGELLDLGVQSGATNVQSISFELSDEKQRDVKTEALRRSAQNAKEKAYALAEGSGVQLGKVRSITENAYSVIPYQRYDVMASMKAEGAPMAPTPIAPGSVSVNAQVTVAYEVA